MSNVSKKELIRELALRKRDDYEFRQRYQGSLWDYCVLSDPVFFTEDRWYLKDLCKHIEDLISKKYLKLMINMPPRAGKSYTVSRACSWALGRVPNGAIMRNSYGAKLAEKFSGDVQSFVRGDAFRSVFKAELNPLKTAKVEWALKEAKDLSYICSGIDGGSTGFGCDLLGISDDLVKDMKVALSATQLESIFHWYLFVHRTRFNLKPPTPEMMICTRWSRKDPAGMILREEPNEWRVFKYPALVKTDSGLKSFCEAYESTDKLLKLYNNHKSRGTDWMFNAVYQQEPIEKGGLLFPADRLKRRYLRDFPKQFDFRIGYCDVADEGEDNLCSIIARVHEGYAYIEDVLFTTAGAEITEVYVKDQIQRFKPTQHLFESNAGGKGYARKVKEMLPESLRSIVSCKRNVTNKETRIILSAGNIIETFYFLYEVDMNPDYRKFFNEMTDYVRGRRNQPDDSVDALTGLSQSLFTSTEVTAEILGGE